MQTIIELNDELFMQAQQVAKQESTTLNNLIEDALAFRLRTLLKPAPSLPIYPGKGGLAPTVADSLTHRALLDAADEMSNS